MLCHRKSRTKYFACCEKEQNSFMGMSARNCGRLFTEIIDIYHFLLTVEKVESVYMYVVVEVVEVDGTAEIYRILWVA